MKTCPHVTCTWVFFVATLSRATLAASLPCSPDVQVSWVVNNSATASELARAANCSGGAFDVEWIGHVEFPETINVLDDTVMKIIGGGAGAVADGANNTQFLNVVDATLFVSDLRIQNCATLNSGGAIYAEGSVMTFNETTWLNNTAGVNGGGIYIYNSTSVSWSGETAWSGNTAGYNGGGVHVRDSSNVSWSEETKWSGNSAGENGGAVYLYKGSEISWGGETSWADNRAGGAGGAVDVQDSSDVSWSEISTFFNNTAGVYGGAVHVFDSSDVSWSGETTFSGNAGVYGGAVFVYDSSSVSWSGETTWSDNSASDDGGAVYMNLGLDVSWSGKTTFSGNAGVYGGAVVVAASANVSWSGQTAWSNNSASGHGGAAIVYDSSSVSWSGETTWSNNTAGDDGGAVIVTDSSGVSWRGETTWSNNSASDNGGAVNVYLGSNVSWSGETTFLRNFAGGMGGAVFVVDSSDVVWSEITTLAYNNGGNFSGAVYVERSSGVSWRGETTWSHNTAGTDGGAVIVYLGSDVSWSGETTFINNIAGDAGGAVVVMASSDVSWSGKATWSNNTAEHHAGAVYLSNCSDVSWSGETTWSFNVGNQSGAVQVEECSGVSWSGETLWSHNTARLAGAVFVSASSDVTWSGQTTWSQNTADSGAAATVLDSSDVSWTGETMWSQNHAEAHGGAVFVQGSSASWSGETTWSNNTAGENGGAVSVRSGSEVSLSGETKWSHNTAGEDGGALHVVSSTIFNISSSMFESNTAGAGGAVMLSGVVIGPKFIQTNFTANRAPRGGAVYSVSSGIETNGGGDPLFPVGYKDCLFRDNEASVTGGAIETAAGHDFAINSVFEANAAGVGGALRLGGSAMLTNCTFVDNTAEDEGPAVSNLGVLDLEGSFRFSGNVLSCENGMYLDSVDGDRYQTVCDGCPVNNSDWIVSVEDGDRVPICVVQLDHTRSEGGDTTIETLELSAGYWRATNDSANVLACYNEDACMGGMTNDPAFCQRGYEGPYCSVCSEGYSKSLAFTCTKCVDDHGGVVIVVVVGVFVLGAAIALSMHLVSGEMEGARRGVVYRLIKRLPFQSIKIVVVVWQILTQFASVANVTYPDVYQRFLDGVNFLNFDVLWIPSAGCLVEVGFHGRLLVSTIGPLVALALLAITYSVGKRRSSGSRAALQKIRHKHMSMVLLITFLVYSSVSATVFQTFACEDLDDRKNYLRADYRVECDSSEHQAFQVFAGIMIFVYPVGIPLFYGYLVYKNRRVLKSEDKVTRETSFHVQPISDLWAPYKPGRFYYEVIECLRRMSLTGVVVFIYPNSAAQVAVTLVIAFSFVVVSERLAPYVSKWDASISLTGHIIVFISMYVALLSKVEVSDERAVSQEVFAGILVAAHACMVVVVVVETVFIFCSMTRNKGPVPRDGPRPRVHCKGSKIPSSNSS